MNRSAITAAGCALIRDLVVAALGCVVALTPVRGAEPTSAENSSIEDQKTPQQLVAALDDSDVAWSVDETGRPHVSLHGEAAEIADIADPPFKDLWHALNDPVRFIAALVVLNEVMARDHWFAAFPGDSRWELDYHGLEINVYSTAEGRQRVEYPDRNGQFDFLTTYWEYSVDPVNRLVQQFAAGRALLRQRERPTVTLTDRTREGLELLSNSDVRWETFGGVGARAVLVHKTEDAVAKPLSIEGLLEALHDPQRFVAAHIILTREFAIGRRFTKCKSDGYRILCNGLYVEMTYHFEGEQKGKWEATYPNPEVQRERLLKQWAATTAFAP